MNTDAHIKALADKLLDFSVFFLSLSDMIQTDLLIAIENHDPEFTDYFENVTELIETALDFFRVYAEWVIINVKKECGDTWDDVRARCFTSARYETLKMRSTETPVLWDILERALKQGGMK